MSAWDDPTPAGRRSGTPAGVRIPDPWAATGEVGGARLPGTLLTRRTRSLVVVAAAPALVLGLLWTLGGGDGAAPAPRASSRPVQAAAAVADPDPARRTYAVALPSLRGLPADAPPGTRLELWVAWEREFHRRGGIQRLLDDVRLVRIVPPALPGSPAAALLSVPANAVGDLLYGDLFGRFAVTVRG